MDGNTTIQGESVMIPQDRLIKYATFFLELGIENVEKLLERNDFDKFNTVILEKQLEEYKHDLEEIKREWMQ